MPIQTFFRASGVLVKRGLRGRLYESGNGTIDCIKASKGGIDSHFFGALKIFVDETHSQIQINSFDTGKHAVGSRHYRHIAADASMFGEVGKFLAPSTMANKHLIKAVKWLRSQGFRHFEGGPWPCCLLGPPNSEYNKTDVDHSDHLHISVHS